MNVTNMTVTYMNVNNTTDTNMTFTVKTINIMSDDGKEAVETILRSEVVFFVLDVVLFLCNKSIN